MRQELLSSHDTRRDSEADTKRCFVAAQERLFGRYELDFETRYIDIPSIGGRAHVIVSGDGPPVLMVAGGGIVAGTWAPLMAELTGYRLYAIDLPGQGLTDPTAYSSSTVRAIGVSFIEDALNSLDLETVPLVAQSFGGSIATWVALDRPGRVAAISYIGCPATILGTSAPIPLRLGTVSWVDRLFSRLDPPSEKQVERIGRMAGHDLSDEPELRDLILAYERLPGSSASLLAIHRSLIRVRGALPEVELGEDQLSSVSQPVQFVWGANDRFGPPASGIRATEIMTDASMHVVDGGHAPWFDDPKAVGEIVDPFLHEHAKE